VLVIIFPVFKIWLEQLCNIPYNYGIGDTALESRSQMVEFKSDKDYLERILANVTILQKKV
jgi:hypothetical protein